MRTPDYRAVGYRAFLTVLKSVARPTGQWLRAAALLVLALGLATALSASDVQAQGGTGTGQQATVTYELHLDTGGADLDYFCIGRKVSLPVSIRRRALVAGNPDAGGNQIRDVQMTAESGNSDVLHVDLDSSPAGTSSDVPFASSVKLEGLSIGSTSVSINAQFETNQSVTTLQVSEPVDVVPCAYKVDVSTVWHTRMYDSGVVIISSITGIVLRNKGIPGLFEQVPPVPGRMVWDTTGNRIRGCELSHTHFPEQRVFARGVIVEGELKISLEFQAMRGNSVYFECLRGTASRIVDCSDYPDGLCDPNLGMDSFTPDNLPDIRVPFEGGTVPARQRLIHSQGVATATAIITVTLVPVR